MRDACNDVEVLSQLTQLISFGVIREYRYTVRSESDTLAPTLWFVQAGQVGVKEYDELRVVVMKV